MKTKIPFPLPKSWLLSLALADVLAPGAALGQFNYVTNNGSITITAYAGSGGSVSIPDTINSLPVSNIGDGAFQNQAWDLWAVSIPNGVTNLGQHAFSDCYNLMSVTFPTNLLTIGSDAFRDDDSLGNLVIPDSVVTIGDEAFDNCHLTSVTIPSNVTFLGASPFRACYWLTNITVASGNPSYTNDACGAVFNEDLTTLIQYPCAGTQNYQSMPPTVTSIADAAFADSFVTNVTMAWAVTNLGPSAFADCYGLTAIIFPEMPPPNSVSAPSADDTVFAGDNLAVVYPPAGVPPNTAGWSTNFAGLPEVFRCMTNSSWFYCLVTNGAITITYCIPAMNLVIPGAFGGLPVTALKGVNALTDSADAGLFGGGASELRTVTIPATVTDIEWAFVNCFDLGTVSIPNSVTNVGDGAFYLSGSGAMTIPPSVISIGDYAFYNSFAGPLKSVTISEGVRSIGNFAFSGCLGLSGVTIPASVTSIGGYAFSLCGFDLCFQGNAPGTGPNLFGGYSWPGVGTVYYLPGTTGWGTNFGGWPTALWYLSQPAILNHGPGFGPANGPFGFTIAWATNATVVVEACTNLAQLVWQPVQTNALVCGTNCFSDPDWTNFTGRFYRVRQP